MQRRKKESKQSDSHHTRKENYLSCHPLPFLFLPLLQFDQFSFVNALLYMFKKEKRKRGVRLNLTQKKKVHYSFESRE